MALSARLARGCRPRGCRAPARRVLGRRVRYHIGSEPGQINGKRWRAAAARDGRGPAGVRPPHGARRPRHAAAECRPRPHRAAPSRALAPDPAGEPGGLPFPF